MTNDHFISIFIISCILLGIQPSVSAQSSDWVYSPYAQYLTNDTTIPPPVGEPADAALSCFRHDTVYVLVMPTRQLYIWLRPDPLLDKYIHLSPYVYCNGNPLKYVDPEGRDIYTINEETGTIEQVRTEGNMHFYYLTNGTNTSFVGSFQENENGLVPLSGNVTFNNMSGETCSFSIKEGNESRSYISPNALASLIGAVGSLGYIDVTVIGFSLSDGSSPSPSISHKNGNVGDIRYLNTDGVSAPTLVNENKFDFHRNESLTAALLKFGWMDMISERVGGYLLPHTSAASERGIRTNHTNHLHIQRYKPIILETYMGIKLNQITVYGKR